MSTSIIDRDREARRHVASNQPMFQARYGRLSGLQASKLEKKYTDLCGMSDAQLGKAREMEVLRRRRAIEFAQEQLELKAREMEDAVGPVVGHLDEAAAQLIQILKASTKAFVESQNRITNS